MATPITPYHKTVYPAIDPTRPELSTAGKSILITGAGSGIGAETALAFAKSGAAHIGIVGRRLANLSATAATIAASHPNTTVHPIVGDITSLPSITAALHAFASSVPSGKIDVLIANAGYINKIAPLAETDPADFWRVFEVNVQGNYNLLRAFREVKASRAVVLHVSSCIGHLPYVPGYAAYQASKLAATKVFDNFRVENEGARVVNYHPGLFRTEIGSTTEEAGLGLEFDEIELAGGWAVWAVSEEAEFLDGSSPSRKYPSTRGVVPPWAQAENETEGDCEMLLDTWHLAADDETQAAAEKANADFEAARQKWNRRDDLLFRFCRVEQLMGDEVVEKEGHMLGRAIAADIYNTRLRPRLWDRRAWTKYRSELFIIQPSRIHGVGKNGISGVQIEYGSIRRDISDGICQTL
ncbi:hypothetical protein B0T16DRAFT_443775 [Cercophora newfieldiana]|uniref:Ketoreductase domain-containing protein n=1 Tax=Cercophora newfieldiana TaxID=92897 RepID=A0AA40CXA0_9PEZI|nr:hypothetical protein B0T16DRAFT_443775 [Cercophora newfieldiana]